MCKDVNTFVSDFNIFDPFSCTTNLNEEQLNQLKDFLFDLIDEQRTINLDIFI